MHSGKQKFRLKQQCQIIKTLLLDSMRTSTCQSAGLSLCYIIVNCYQSFYPRRVIMFHLRGNIILSPLLRTKPVGI
jgi:hypothetical protein